MTRDRLRHPDAVLSADLLAQAADIPSPVIEVVTRSWTTADLRSAARMAVSRCHLSSSAITDDPYDLALAGIGLAVAIDPDISWLDAVYAGQQEIFDARRAVRKSRGRDTAGEPMPRFAAYWLAFPGVPFGRVEARLALRSVIAALPEKHLDTLLLLAWTDSMEAAAKAAGCTAQAMRIRAQKARRAALALWFDGETPPPLSRLLPYRATHEGRVCRAGHEIASDNIRWETSAAGRRHARCKSCRQLADRRRREHETNPKGTVMTERLTERLTNTPTTETVRLAATQCPDGIPEEDFDRWLASIHHWAEEVADRCGDDWGRDFPYAFEPPFEYLVIRKADATSVKGGARASAADLVHFDGFPDADPDGLLVQAVTDALCELAPYAP